jgi:NADPH:quinone reductase
MSMMRAVVVEVGSPNRLVLREVEEASPGPSETLIRVAAVSLNRGEVRRATAITQAGFRPGWDVAGTVERAAEDGSGPPEGVSFAQAATLPFAGLTALYALEKGGWLLVKNVLITGATGGVGLFACRLARMAGAHVVGLIRRADREALVRQAGAREVVTGNDVSAARERGPYNLVLESVGDEVLAGTLAMLAPGGTCVSLGTTAGAESTFDVRSFYFTGGATLYGFILFYEVLIRPASEGLGRLLRLVADGTLQPHIELEAPWEEIGDIAGRLVDRDYAGKAVLHVG